MPIELAQLTLDRATIEIRYPFAYHLWDHSGHIWSKIATLGNDIKLEKAEPGVVRGVLDRRFIFSVELDKAFVIQYEPDRPLEELRSISEQFFGILIEKLNIEELSRVGARLIYLKEFDSMKAATKDLLSITKFENASGTHFGIPFAPLYADYAIKNEGEDNAYRIEVRSYRQGIEHESILGHEWAGIEPGKRERNVLLFDVDYFTMKTILVSQFSSDEWLAQVVHMVNRDGNFFLRGSR